MKTYKVKNYKGNLVESLKKFSDSHEGMKIVEACEDGDDLKIKAEESEKIQEAATNSIFAVMFHDDDKFKTIIGIGSNEKKAKKILDSAKGYEHAKSDIKIVKLDLNRLIEYQLTNLDFA